MADSADVRVDWKGLTVVARDATGPDRGLYTLSFRLSEKPDEGWIDLFNSTYAREGSTAFVMGPGPGIVGWAIQWQVPDADIEGAWHVVKTKVAAANAGFPEVLLRREEQARERRNRLSELEARREDVLRRLRSFE